MKVSAISRTVLVMVTLFASSFLIPVLIQPIHASTPASGTITPSQTSLQWQGQSYVLASTPTPQACPPATDPANALCDHFFLNLNLPSNFWTTNAGVLTIAISWTSGLSTFDIFVYQITNQGSTLVGQSVSLTSTSQEVVLLTPPPGTYEVRVVPFLVIESGYNGTASLTVGGLVVNPVRPNGGIKFAPAVVADSQRTFGEPSIYRDTSGNVWASGPWGVSTTQSFLQKSTDNGDSYHVVSPVGLRPNNPPGGGDTDLVTDDQGTAYFADLEGAFTNVGLGVSNDGGNTWKTNSFATANTLEDRQWLAIDNGPTTSPADNTVFLTLHVPVLGVQVYSSPGSLGVTDVIGGLVYQNAADTTFVAPDASCGRVQFDPVNRNLYLVCARGSHVEIIRGHVNPSQRTGIHFTRLATPNSPGGGETNELFPVLSIDTAGNLYAVWVDKNNFNVYLTVSTNQGNTWTSPIQLNGDPANTNVFPWVVAGSTGLVDAVFLGTNAPSPFGPSTFPSWFNSRSAATVYKWFPYLVQVHFNFTSPGSSTIYQAQVSDHPTHYGQICDIGTLCSAINGDRVLADFITVTIDQTGAARVLYPDTTNQHHGAAVFESRQIAGPGILGSTISAPLPTNPEPDPAGDAQFPHYSPTGTGPNQRALDFLSVQLTQPDAAHLTVNMQVLDATSLLPPTGADAVVWLTRFQVKALGDDGEESYRIFYVGAQSIAGASPTFFSGTGISASDSGIPGDGCIVTAFIQANPVLRNCKILQYPQEKAQTGTLNSLTGVISVTVPLTDIGSPHLGDTLFSVTSLSFGQVLGSPILQDVDATRAFDFTVTNGAPTTVQTVTGGGYIFTDAADDKGNFGLVARTDNTGQIGYIDRGAGLTFKASLITSVAISGNQATIRGVGFANSVTTNYTIIVQDNAEPGAGADTFSIQLGTGYSRSGTLQGGNIQIH